MTTAFTGYTFKPTDTTGDLTRSRSLPDALADIVNVKDFGALGDGVTDDTAAILDAIDAAWKTSGTWNGNLALFGAAGYFGGFRNRPLFFPAGEYIVMDTLYAEALIGAWMFGAGSKNTKITYKGSKTNINPNVLGNNRCSTVFFNGCLWGCVEGITFAMKPSGVIANALADNTVAFNWNWDGGPSTPNPGTSTVNSSFVTFIDCGFQDATYGIDMGDSQGTTSWGWQTDTGSFFGCWVDNCFYGVRSFEGNSIHQCWIGGSIKNCSQVGAVGFHLNASGPCLIQDVRFENNETDYECGNSQPAYLVNCYSESDTFCISGISGTVLQGCVHNCATGTGVVSGQNSATNALIIDNCRMNGRLYGGGNFYCRETDFGYSGWASQSLGNKNIVELTPPTGPLITGLPSGIGGSAVVSNTFTFSQLPPVTAAAEGLVVSISDSSTTTWGATVSAGGGTNHVLLRSNGTDWTVVGI